MKENKNKCVNNKAKDVLKIINQQHTAMTTKQHSNEDTETNDGTNLNELLNDDNVFHKRYHCCIKNNTLQTNFVMSFETQPLHGTSTPDNMSQHVKQNDGIVCAQRKKIQLHRPFCVLQTKMIN